MFGNPLSFGFPAGSGIGWWLAIILMAAIREKITYSNVPAPLRGAGITFILTGLMGIAFMIFKKVRLLMTESILKKLRRKICVVV